MTGRRSYLKFAGAAAASVPLLAGQGSAATTRHGVSFDRVVDMVDDAGCDPTGGAACDGALRSAAGHNTLLRFPSGTYRFTQKNSLVGLNNFGIVGVGDVTFTVPANFNEEVIVADDGTGLVVENITIDQSAAGATPELNLGADDNLYVQNVSVVGQGIHPDTQHRSAPGTNPRVENALAVAVHAPNGTGVVDNFTAHNAGFMGAYTRVGVWVGKQHRGTLTLSNCNVEGFPNNGVYASRCPGAVQIEGGVFRNNDVSQVRISGPDSYVVGATIEVDPAAGNSPNPNGMINGLGINIESGQSGTGGALVRGCDISIAPNANSNGGIDVFGNHGSVTIEDTRIRTDTTSPYAYGIRASTPDGGSLYNAPAGAVDMQIRNVSLTGSAPGGIGMFIQGRPESVIENCCIHQEGASRIGVLLENSSGTTIANSTIDATQQALLLRGTDANVTGLDRSGGCPAPNLAAGSAPADVPSTDSTGSDADTSASDDASADDAASDDAGDTADSAPAADAPADESSDDADDSSGGSSAGTYVDISRIELPSRYTDGSSGGSSSGGGGNGDDGDTSGSYVDISRLALPPRYTGGSGSSGADEEIVVSGAPAAETVSAYEIDTDADLAPGADFDGDAAITDDGATGLVANYRDSYEYEGEGFSLTLGDEATLKLDEDAGTVTVLGADDGVVTDYSIEVSGALTPTDSVTGEDETTGDTAEGRVANWRDEYEYTGDLRSATLGDEVSVTLE